MRGNRRSPSASMNASPYGMGVSPTVEEDRANQQTDLAPERYVQYVQLSVVYCGVVHIVWCIAE